jgi:hypothetical protein
MSIAQPHVDPREPGRSADEIDGLLREFFQGALPTSWPPFQRPAREILPSPHPLSWRRRFRSTLALAASLILLALSLGFLSGKFADRPPQLPGGIDNTGQREKPYQDDSHHGQPRPEKK